MPKAYFVKVDKDTTWSNILNSVQKQVNSMSKKLEYFSIVELHLDISDFNNLVASISQPNPVYAGWSSQSISDNCGIWNCITLKCDSDSRSIIIYTSGRTFPLYVAIDLESIKSGTLNTNSNFVG